MAIVKSKVNLNAATANLKTAGSANADVVTSHTGETKEVKQGLNASFTNILLDEKQTKAVTDAAKTLPEDALVKDVLVAAKLDPKQFDNQDLLGKVFKGNEKSVKSG